MVLVTVLCATLTVWDMYRKTAREARGNLADLGMVLAEQTSRYVQVVDLLLRELQSRSHSLQIQTPDEFIQALGGEDTHGFLRERMINLPQANALVIVDADGRLLNTSREWPAQRVDVSGGDVYAHFRSSGADELFISLPVRSRVTGNWTVYLARRISGPDGVLLGIVAGALDVKYLADFYSAIGAHQGVRVTLLRRDGTILARYPDMDRQCRQGVAAGSPWYAESAARGGYVSPGLASGIPSIVSVNPLPDYPLVVNVAMRAARGAGEAGRSRLSMSRRASSSRPSPSSCCSASLDSNSAGSRNRTPSCNAPRRWRGRTSCGCATTRNWRPTGSGNRTASCASCRSPRARR